MSTEIKPRKHADMAAKYMADGSLQCWLWEDDTKRWRLTVAPAWRKWLYYYVGHEAPTEPPKRQITIAGITFDAPETEVPNTGEEYCTFTVRGSRVNTWKERWSSNVVDLERLRNGFVHTTHKAAELHGEALVKLNRQLCGAGDVQ